MIDVSTKTLATGYTAEMDTIDESAWYQQLLTFDDANLYQTWAYAAVTSSRRNMSHLILRKHNKIVAIAQSRIARPPMLRTGVAYVFWGPLWRRRETAEASEEIFRQVVRALRNEYVGRRGLVLRIFPLLYDSDSPSFSTILTEEGFAPVALQARGRTILMDLAPPLEDIRNGMGSHWKRELKEAERKALEIVQGNTEELFDRFIDIYREMVSRKRFVEPNDIDQFRRIQRQLPENLKMKVMLCRSGERICAGLICSAIGRNALYLFGATGNMGMKSRGSYLLQWTLVEQLKRNNVSVYDLNGINRMNNPGTYKFKSDFSGKHGREVCFLGRFDSYDSLVGRWGVQCWDILKHRWQSFNEYVRVSGLLNRG